MEAIKQATEDETQNAGEFAHLPESIRRKLEAEGPDLYAMRVTGTGMCLRCPDGTLAIFSPHKKPKDGDACRVVNKAGRDGFCYVEFHGDQVELRGQAEPFGTMVKRDDLKLIHPLVSSIPPASDGGRKSLRQLGPIHGDGSPWELRQSMAGDMDALLYHPVHAPEGLQVEDPRCPPELAARAKQFRQWHKAQGRMRKQ